MSLDALARRFRAFGEVECKGSSLLYERLSIAIAQDNELLALAAQSREGQPAPNLLFGAARFLLLQETSAPLARFHADLSAVPADPSDAFPTFRDFCLGNRQEIVAILTTRLVQTNEVGRCAYLLPAFRLVAEAAGLPLTLVEVGASAGLNLLWDKYGYRYRHHGCAQAIGDRNSPVPIETELIGDRAPILLGAMPAVSDRIGLDLNIIDLQDADDARWLRALIWPEHAARFALLDAATAVLSKEPPRLVRGDAVALLAGVIETIPVGTALVIFHTHVINQFSPEARERLSGVISEASKERVIYRIGSDLGGGAGGRFLLKLLTYKGGQTAEEQLAYCDGHGRTIEWLA